MDSSLRDMLTAVREGRLDPAEAARRLTDPLAGPTAPDDSAAPATPDTRTSASADSDGAGPETRGAAGGGTDTDQAAHAGSTDAPSAAAWADAVDDPTSTSPPHPPGTPPGPSTPPAAEAPPVPRTPPAPPIVRPRTDTGTHAVGRVTDAPATTDLRLRAMTRRVRVIADPSVATVSVDGPHELRREGTTLILESDRDLPFGDPFAFLPAMRGSFRLQGGEGKPFSLGGDLVVRLNPAIALDVDVTAGSLSVRGVPRVRARVTAGSARIEEMAGPLDLHVVGGTAKVDMTARGSANRIRCESGSISLRLRRDSDVRLRPDAQLGRIIIDGAEGGKEIVVGAGSGRLDVEIVMGNLQVEVERD